MTEITDYAVIRTGGKQYRVSAGDRLRVETIPSATGDVITFPVLFVKTGASLQTGRPTVAGATVKGQVVKQMRAKKILVFKKRRKKGYKKLQGHRQNLTEVVIQSIEVGS